jgi:tetratricopeptide (TPR) repeat protein
MLSLFPLARRVACVAAVLALCAPSLVRAQREFIEEIEPDADKKGTLDQFDLDAPDVARGKPDPKKPPVATKPTPQVKGDAGPAPAGASGDKDTPDAGAAETADGGVPDDGEGSFAVMVIETSHEALLEKWSVRGEAVRKGEVARAKKLLPDVEAALLDFGAQGLPGGVQSPAAASALVLEAKRALDDGSLESAQAAVELAQRAAPDLASVYTAQALVAWRAGDVGKTIDALLAAVRAHGRDPLALTSVAARALVVVVLALLSVLIAFTLLAGLRALRYLAFDVATLLPKGAHPAQVLALVALVAVAPFFLGAGPVFSSLFVLALTWMYLERNERVMVSIVAVVIVALPLALTAVSQLVSWPSSRAARAHRAMTTVEARAERRDIEALDAASRTALEQGALALTAKREGKLDDARALLDAVVQKHGDDPAVAWAHGEIGVLAALREDQETALKELGKAIASDPRLSAASFNSSMIHFRAGDTRRAEEAVQTLVEKDPELLSGFRRTTYRAPDQAIVHNRAFVDVMPRPIAALTDPSGVASEAAEVEATLSRMLLRGQTGQRALGALAAFPLVFVLAFALRRKLKPARACVRCGDAACPRIDGPNVPEDTCSQCYHAFVSTRSRIDAGVKLRKERAITRRARRVSRFVLALSLVFPGAGHIYCGAAVRGALFVGLWTLGLGALSLALEIWPMPRLAGPWGQTPGLVLVGIYLVVVWALSLRSSFEAAADAVSTRRK